jgi:branched-chain amino acid transport system permease protein
MRDHTVRVLLGVAAVLLAGMPFMPQWLMFLITLALAKGLVVLGLVLLMRTGLVSFGQGLYYCLGAYAAALLDHAAGVHDAALMLVAALAVPVAVALVLGLLLASYRGIFFAMLSMAFSMIVFGLLIKTSALGSSDGFNVATRSIFGIAIADGNNGRVFLAATVVLSVIAAVALHRYLNSHRGRLSAAVRDNELRVEYLGASVRNVVHLNYVIAAALGGIGGGLTALAVGHIDPDMAYWTTSGEFVFVAVLSGTGNVLAPFFGSVIFEAIRTLANQYAPNIWQMTLGIAMLAIIMFLPAGLWAVFRRRARSA